MNFRGSLKAFKEFASWVSKTVRRNPPLRWLVEDWAFVFASLLLIRFLYKVIQLSLSFPNLFDPQVLISTDSRFPVFVLFIVIIAVAFLLEAFKQPRKKKPSWFTLFLRENAQGLVLFAAFFVIYFVLAHVFNRADFNNNNVFFAADTHNWRLRIASVDGYLMQMRSIHPLAFLILRPWAFALSLILQTDLFNAVRVFVALVGAGSVFLVWTFIKNSTGSGAHAFLFAFIFGTSTSQLLFNSVTETYIFSGFLIILFFVLLQKRVKFPWLVLTGIGIFGVTISNLLQASIGYLLVELKVKRVAIFLVLVMVISTGLGFVHQAMYPDSVAFYDTTDSGGEFQGYLRSAQEEGWLWRSKLVSSDMFLFSVVAPQPFYQTYHKEGRDIFPKFNFMQGDRLSQYVGVGKVAVWLWLGILFAAIAYFIQSLRKQGFSEANRFVLAFVVCLGFNFLFHLVYGFEPFLYSSDWSYALVFFVALASRPLAKNNWAQGALIVFLGLLTLNNLTFLYSLMNGISPFVP